MRYCSLSEKIKSDGGSTPEIWAIPEGCTECEHIIIAKGMGWRQGNIFKAAWRMGDKAGVDVAYDLRKIIFYAQRELESLELSGQRHKDDCSFQIDPSLMSGATFDGPPLELTPPGVIVGHTSPDYR
jgi:hypothetical protein